MRMQILMFARIWKPSSISTSQRDTPLHGYIEVRYHPFPERSKTRSCSKLFLNGSDKVFTNYQKLSCSFFKFADEGPDDMPAHIKASMMGSSVTIPITCGRLNLGTWQGVWLCEHRDSGGRRNIVVTLQGS
jgi:hypothetical protein